MAMKKKVAAKKAAVARPKDAAVTILYPGGKDQHGYARGTQTVTVRLRIEGGVLQARIGTCGAGYGYLTEKGAAMALRAIVDKYDNAGRRNAMSDTDLGTKMRTALAKRDAKARAQAIAAVTAAYDKANAANEGKLDARVAELSPYLTAAFAYGRSLLIGK